MDAERFESLLRSLSAAPSRRGALRLLAGLVLGSPLALGIAGADAHNKQKKCKKLDDKDKRKKCRKKAKKHNAAHNQPACFCPVDRECLSNGSCAQACDADPMSSDSCPATCGCSNPSTEGQNHCVPLILTCGDIPQSCTATAQCPLGQHCQETLCGEGDTPVDRCVPLCTA